MDTAGGVFVIVDASEGPCFLLSAGGSPRTTFARDVLDAKAFYAKTLAGRRAVQCLLFCRTRLLPSFTVSHD